ncbi:MAG: NAD(P)/FAD-dependent oxidoreductase [Bacteroidales bacterium]|nr:NAD(P)/FAD-dependent oxidoreductase [Bacteroidales bacterium]
MKEQKSWGIIGGGILGMTLALRLKQAGQKVTIFESASRPGGLASSWELDGMTWDKYYHVILMSDLNTRKILKEIGLEDSMNWVETKTGFYSEGKLYSMSNLIEFFKFPPINLIDKFRLGLTIFVASKITNWKRLEQIPVATWLTRWSGKRVFEKIWLPLLKAKLGDNYKHTSAAFIWSTIQRMYAARKSGLKKEMFGYMTGGYETINQRFANHLQEIGVEFKLNLSVSGISPENDGSLLVSTKEGVLKFDQVISTLSPSQSVNLAGSLKEEEKARHRNVKYLGVICPSVILSKPISPYYVTNITDDVAPFTGIIEMTALIDKEKELQGKNLIYLPKYVDSNDPLFESSDAEIRNIFLGALFKMYPELSDKDVQYFGVARARIVFALPTLGYSVSLPGIQTSIKNFHIVNSAQIINGTLNVNETILVAESKLKVIFDELSK